MEKMLVRQRWMALPWGVYTLAIALVLAAIGLYAVKYHPGEKPSVRVVLPMYGLFLYCVLALLFNWRTAVVTPGGLHVGVWPFLVRFPRHLRRNKIRHCYIRNVSTYDDGTLLESYYSAGVESIHGEQIDVSSPHDTAEEATQPASKIAHVLNQAPGQSPIEVRVVEQLPKRAEVLKTIILMGLWLALFIAAVLTGFEWEERVSRS